MCCIPGTQEFAKKNVGSAIFPCYTCGFGSKCMVGGFYERYGEQGIQNLKITPELFTCWEDSPTTVAEIIEVAGKIAEKK